jgi:hypothetical protein
MEVFMKTVGRWATANTWDLMGRTSLLLAFGQAVGMGGFNAFITQPERTPAAPVIYSEVAMEAFQAAEEGALVGLGLEHFLVPLGAGKKVLHPKDKFSWFEKPAGVAGFFVITAPHAW